MVLKYLIEKEFKQMRRNPIIPRLILAFPCMMMILMPWAANLEIKYNNLAVVDLDYSALSRRLVEKVASTDYSIWWRTRRITAVHWRAWSAERRMSFWRFRVTLPNL